jgi:hypothetical protein
MSYPNTSFTHSFVVPAGGVRPINSGGRFFRVVKTNVPLAIQRSGAAYQPYEQGDAEELADGETFDRLEVKNTAAVDAYVEIYVGYGRREQSRQTVMEPQTRMRSLFAGNIGPGATVAVPPPQAAGDLQRKAVMVYNGSAELRLDVLDASGVKCAFVPFQQGHTFPVSQACGVHNPHGVAVECYISEVVWVA